MLRGVDMRLATVLLLVSVLIFPSISFAEKFKCKNLGVVKGNIKDYYSGLKIQFVGQAENANVKQNYRSGDAEGVRTAILNSSATVADALQTKAKQQCCFNLDKDIYYGVSNYDISVNMTSSYFAVFGEGDLFCGYK